ncbi:MAG: cation-transporting P-type ATPase [Patescibacteria group bacterium]
MIDILFEKYNTSADGLATTDVQARLKEYGSNVLVERKKTPILLQFLGEFKDLMVIILIFAAAIAAAWGELTDATVILCIVVANAIIGFIQKYKAERAVEALKKMLHPKARVVRGGEEMMISAANVVPGDILVLNEGDKVAADALLIEENELFANESVLTGESVPVEKNVFETFEDQSSLLCMGTEITRGTGRAVVVATGMETRFGKIAELTSTTKKDLTPLQKELNTIGKYIGAVTVVISAVLIVIGTFFQKLPFVHSFLFATSVAVAAVPEGLPVTITIALAMGVQRLAKKNAIVKQLASVETLGSTTVICSDKTGTLTKNEMTVQEVVIGSERLAVTGVGYEPDGRIQQSKNTEMLARLVEIAAVCNNATLHQADGRYSVLGDPTEGALLTLAIKAGMPLENLKRRFTKLGEIPFDSNRKRMSVIVKDTQTGKVFAFVKGAPDSILSVSEISATDKRNLLSQNDEMARRALRVIAMAWKELPSDESNFGKSGKKYDITLIESELTTLGLVGIIDPPREDVKEAVKLTQKAGIKVYIVTGDYGLTASAIAHELGIVGTGEVKIITGDDMNILDESALRELLKDTKREIIFARVNPEHKLKIVSALKENGHVVAVTGDGVNDAPALKRADIGIAMGISGTDVSKEAANMVLTDDSFSTIVRAIEEGRVIYENLKKFLAYIFSSNIGELVTVFTGLALGLPAPLTAILILMVNVGTDVLPALALGVDPPEHDIMEQPPRKPTDRIMNKRFVARYVFLGTYIGIVVVAGYFWELYNLGWTWGDVIERNGSLFAAASSFAFVLLIMIQMANTFNARSDHHSIFTIGFFSNTKLLMAIALSVGASVAFVEFPFFQRWLHTTHLELSSWIMISATSLSVIFVEEIRKVIARRYAVSQS